MEHRARDRPQDSHLARELGDHRRHPVRAFIASRASRARRPGGQALADLALDHRHPALDARQLLDRAQQRTGGDPVGQVRDHLRRRRLSPRSSIFITSPQCTVDVRDAAGRVDERVAAGARRSRSRVRDATRSARYSDSTPSPPPTSSTTSSSVSSAARPITPRMFESIRKFCPSSRSGRMLELLQPPQAGLDRRRGLTARAIGVDCAGGPRRVRPCGVSLTVRRARRDGACRATALTSRTRAPRCAPPPRRAAAGETPRSWARKATVCATNAGWLRSLAHDLRRQVGGVGLHQQPLLGHLPRRLGQVGGVLVGDVAGERDRIAALQAVVQARRASRSSGSRR